MFLLMLGFLGLFIFLAFMPQGGVQVALGGFWALLALAYLASILYSLGGLLFS